MTQQQESGLLSAMTKYVAAEAAFTKAQQASRDAGAAADAAHVNATVTVPKANKAIQDAANTAFFTAQDAQLAAISAAQQATADLGNASQALNQAILDSRQTGVPELV